MKQSLALQSFLSFCSKSPLCLLVEIGANAGKICVKILQHADDKNCFEENFFAYSKKTKCVRGVV